MAAKEWRVSNSLFDRTSANVVWRQSHIIAAALLVSVSPGALAATAVTADVELDFGVLAVKANDAVSTMTITSAGGVSSTGDIIPIGGATRGEYRLTGFPPGVLLDVTLDNATLSAGGGDLPEYLTVLNYDNPTLFSDASGEAVVPVGATLQTSGSTTMYVDAPYSDSTQIRVRYWSQPDLDYLTHFDSVTISAQLQSTLTLLEQQMLSFGTIAAYSDPVFSASLILAPGGALTLGGGGGSANIIALGGSQVGVIQVSGAAPNNVVTITPEAGSVFISHVTEGGNSARLIVKDFVTSPASPGLTNGSGELEVRVGATLETEITNKAFIDGNYSGTYSLTVTY